MSLEIKTICETDEEVFDRRVNEAIRAGWRLDLTTYRAAAAAAGDMLNGRRIVSYNHVILLRGEL